MKWLVRTIPGLAVLVAVALAIGWELPAQLRVERNIGMSAAAEKAYALPVDPREWKRWTVCKQGIG